MSTDTINKQSIIEPVLATLEESRRDLHRSCFTELPDEVFQYIAMLPVESHVLALQAAYIGFIAGKTETRMELIEAFLKSAGAEIQSFPKDQSEYN